MHIMTHTHLDSPNGSARVAIEIVRQNTLDVFIRGCVPIQKLDCNAKNCKAGK